MGYESKVYIHCDKNAYNRIKNYLNKYTPDTISKVTWGINTKEEYLIEYDWVKWYENDPTYFPEVDKIMSVLSELEEDETKGSFGYLRIGEDYEDIETRWNDEFYRLYPQIDLYRDDNVKDMEEIKEQSEDIEL